MARNFYLIPCLTLLQVTSYLLVLGTALFLSIYRQQSDLLSLHFARCHKPAELTLRYRAAWRHSCDMGNWKYWWGKLILSNIWSHSPEDSALRLCQNEGNTLCHPWSHHFNLFWSNIWHLGMASSHEVSLLGMALYHGGKSSLHSDSRDHLLSTLPAALLLHGARFWPC